jgi:hypothetical protein
MAPVAILIVDVPARHLLRIQSQLGIAFSALYLAGGQSDKHSFNED